MPVQGLEERLDAADDEATQDLAIALDFAHAGRACNALHWRRPDKAGFDSLGEMFFGHAGQTRLDWEPGLPCCH